MVVSVTNCNLAAIKPVVSITDTIDAYSTKEFAFTVPYRLPLTESRQNITCQIVVRDDQLVAIAKRRYVKHCLGLQPDLKIMVELPFHYLNNGESVEVCDSGNATTKSLSRKANEFCTHTISS